MRSFLALLAGSLALAAIVPYLIDIIKGNTKPNVVSWFTWTLMLVIATTAAFAAHETKSALLTLGDTIGTAITLLLGLKYGIAKFSWFDGLCQVLALISVALWLIYNSPTIAIMAVVGIDIIASIPTARHAWFYPAEETWQTFAILAFASLITLSSLTSLSPAGLALPLYFLAGNSIISIVIIYRRNKLYDVVASKNHKD